MPLKSIKNPDLTLDYLMTAWPETIPVFMRHKMLCVGCMIGSFHTVTDACREYGLNIETFYEELVAALRLAQTLQPE